MNDPDTQPQGLDWRRNLYASWLAQIFSLAGFGFMFPFIPYFLQELGVTDPTQLKVWVGIYTSVPSLVLAIVAPIWGILADRFGRKIMVMRAILGGAIFVAMMSVATGPGMVLTFRIMIGVFAGSVPASATLIPRRSCCHVRRVLAGAGVGGRREERACIRPPVDPPAPGGERPSRQDDRPTRKRDRFSRHARPILVAPADHWIGANRLRDPLPGSVLSDAARSIYSTLCSGVSRTH